ncbi:MAG: hypothetical protein AAGA28_14090 [Pseudomonadota bacterium]
MTRTPPRIGFAVVTGALLAFLTSCDEVVIAMFISGADYPTLTRNMFGAPRDRIDPRLASMYAITAGVTPFVMTRAQIFGQERSGR